MDSILIRTVVHSAVVLMTIHPGFIGLKSKAHNRGPDRDPLVVETCSGEDLLLPLLLPALPGHLA